MSELMESRADGGLLDVRCGTEFGLVAVRMGALKADECK